MSDLMERTNLLEDQDAAYAIEGFKDSLTDKQRDAFDVLMVKRGYNGYGKLGEVSFFFPEFKGVVYITEPQENKYIVLAFSANRTNADIYQYFGSLEKAHKEVNAWATRKINAINEERESREKKKALTKRLKEFVSIGDVFYTSWGYEQTNVDYYKVVGFRGTSTLELQQIGAIATPTSHGPCGGEKIPNPEHLIGEVFSKQASVYQYREDRPVNVRVKIDTVSSASLKEKEPDGTYKPDYYSWGY